MYSASSSHARPSLDLVAVEFEKIRGAIQVDFILSIEILVIASGMVQSSALRVQVSVLCSVALAMTIGVCGDVACIVKFDDVGLMLHQGQGEGLWVQVPEATGVYILKAAPKLMERMTVLGTLAMFVVGGGILVHGAPRLAHRITEMAAHAGVLWSPLLTLLFQMRAGWLAGAIAFGVVQLLAKLSPTA